MSSWRPSLRMAWRDARRSRARSILVMVMIALPVLGVTAADVIMQTTDVSGTEALDRRLGTADAGINFQKGVSRVAHGFDPDDLGSSEGRKSTPLRGLEDIRATLGEDVRGIPWVDSGGRVVTDGGVVNAEVSMLDLRDPLADGIFRVDEGRQPAAADEVVVNTYLAGRGFEIGDQLEVENRGTYTVVGIGESTSYRSHPRLVGLSPELVGAAAQRSSTWLVDAGPVSWTEVRELNEIGGTVLSRAVMLDPPPESELPPEIQGWGTGVDEALAAVAALIVVMALIEVVLLAGPAFAVGARRQSRAIALLAASGGTPRQARRVVLASGVVLGSLGAALGVLIGIGVAAAILPIVQRFSGSWLGPFDVPWWHLLGIACFGLLSALLAAVVPAWIASRQDVVAVLAGRRGDRPAGARSPVLGAALLGIGVAMSAYGAFAASSGEFVIAAGAIPAVLGMILLVPLVLTGLARVSRVLPLSLRYAVRDAARHRTRTVPAVAAVAATVAGVVALGVANASDGEQSRATYTPMLPIGQGFVTARGAETDWEQMAAVVAEHAPEAETDVVDGIPNGRKEFVFTAPGHQRLLDGYATSTGTTVLVSDGEFVPPGEGFDEDEVAAAEAMLARGGAVVFTSVEVAEDTATIVVRRWGDSGKPERLGKITVPAVFLQGDGVVTAQAVLSPEIPPELGVEARTVALLVHGAEITTAQESDIQEALGALSRSASFDVERGYTADDETMILLLVLGGLGGLLMLGGTLTATFLALSDARPDLATLSAVGASPRSRRRVAASYALVVGLVGSVLGAAVGFIPGIAVTYPLTGEGWATDMNPALPDHFLAVPWLLIVPLVLGLPLLTALIVGLTARSRLPLVARLD